MVGLVTGIASMGASMAAGSAQASQLQAVQDAQLAANQNWVNYQNQIHQEQVDNENKFRQQAENARQSTLQQVAPANQQKQQQAEAGRLTDYYNNPEGYAPGEKPNDPNNVASVALSGQDVSGNKGAGHAAAVSQASNVARQRIAALATANSYGNSQEGLGTVVPREFQVGGNAIQTADDIRNANLKTYGVEQQVAPISYQVGSGTEALGGIAKALGGMGGTLISSGLTRLAGGGLGASKLFAAGPWGGSP